MRVSELILATCETSWVCPHDAEPIVGCSIEESTHILRRTFQLPTLGRGSPREGLTWSTIQVCNTEDIGGTALSTVKSTGARIELGALLDGDCRSEGGGCADDGSDEDCGAHIGWMGRVFPEEMEREVGCWKVSEEVFLKTCLGVMEENSQSRRGIDDLFIPMKR
jgi:hypothetical protein